MFRTDQCFISIHNTLLDIGLDVLFHKLTCLGLFLIVFTVIASIVHFSWL